jgi:hypothetical protein
MIVLNGSGSLLPSTMTHEYFPSIEAAMFRMEFGTRCFATALFGLNKMTLFITEADAAGRTPNR